MAQNQTQDDNRREIARRETIQPPQDPRQEQERVQREREARAKEEHGVREQSNNPATAVRRSYDGIDQPGLHPANQPDPDSKAYKATRLDLEDLTGNPGHRNVNPDAPANSINKPTDPQTGRLESINEPPGVEPGTTEAPSTANTIPPNPHPQLASINEPPGSNVMGKTAEDVGAPVIEALEPDEAELTAADLTMSVHGSGFRQDSKIMFGPDELATTYVSAEELTASVSPTGYEAAGVVPVKVQTGGHTSEEVEFELLDPEIPVTSRTSKRTKPKKTKKSKR